MKLKKKNREAIKLIRKWQNDKSDYDEKTYEELKNNERYCHRCLLRKDDKTKICPKCDCSCFYKE